MSKIIDTGRGILAEIKIYLARANSYFVIINSGMLIFLLLSKLQEFGFNINIQNYFIPSFLASISGALIIGYLDTRWGFFREEAKRNTHRNPYLMQISEDVQQILKRLDNIEKDSIHKPNEVVETTSSGASKQE